jgi:DNA topoisomerase-1
VLWNEPTGEKCPQCGSLLVKKVLKNRTIISCSSIKCGYKVEEAPEPTETE